MLRRNAIVSTVERFPNRFNTAICVVSMSPSFTAAIARFASCSTRSIASATKTRAASCITDVAASPRVPAAFYVRNTQDSIA